MKVGTEAINVVLKPKYELLDSNFEGYKLNLRKIPIHSKQVEEGKRKEEVLAKGSSHVTIWAVLI